MSSSDGRVWMVAGLASGEDAWQVRKAREISEAEFAELEHNARFVAELASQRDYGRLLSAASRLDALLVTVEKDLTIDGHLSPHTADAIPLDLVAVGAAARQLEAALVRQIDADSGLPQHIRTAFHDVRDGVRANSAYLVAHEMTDRDRAPQACLMLREGEVAFDGTTRNTAREVVRALLGLSFSVVAAYLSAYAERFEEVATVLEQEAAGVPEGSPCLISFVGPASKPRQMSFKDIPLREIEALRRFHSQHSTVQSPEQLVHGALALAAATLRTDLHVGGTDIAAGLLDGTAAEGINALPTASFELDLQVLGSTPIDYWGPVVYRIAQDGHERELFAGAVQSAEVDGDRVSLTCEGATDLMERVTGGTLASGVAKEELVRSLLLAAGLSADLLLFETSAPASEEEAFEVLVPIRGLKVSKAIAVGGVEIVPVSSGEAALDGLERDGAVAARLHAAFADADGYGRVLVTDTMLPRAEEAGVSAVEVAVAWLTIRGRYGFARLPDGRAQPFARQEALRGPQTGVAVLVRGLDTGRRWMRLRRVDDVPHVRTLESAAPLDPPLPPDLLPEEQHALLALRRATREGLLEGQLEALWEAINFYATGTRGEKHFSKPELDLLRDTSPAWMSVGQKQRFMSLIDDLNSPSLRVRVNLQLRRDGVPLTEPERHLLFRTLRSARNRPAHGEVPVPPTRAEIQRGISIVARMLVYRIARRSGP